MAKPRPSSLPYEDKHRRPSVFDMPRFTMKKDEKARIVLIEPQAEMDITHFVREYGYVVCLGDYEVVMETGEDAERCPFCRVATPGGDAPVTQARRRFATHIIRYATDVKGNLRKPLAWDVLAWIFADDKFGTLVRRAEALKEVAGVKGDLRRRDLFITCEEEKFQKLDIQTANEALWLQDKETKNAVAASYKAEKAQDLHILLGREISEEQAAIILERKGLAGGGGAPSGVPATGDSLDEIFGSTGGSASVETELMEALEGEEKEAESEEAAPMEVDFDDLLSS